MCGALSAGPDVLFAAERVGTRSCKGLRGVAIIREVPLDHISDEDLATRYRAAAHSNERELYVNELFRRNYTRVARWCLRFVDDRETAADLSQEIFAKAYQNLQSFQGQSKFSTWLFSITRNHCLNAVRANARQATELKAEVNEEFMAEIPDGSATPYDEAERKSSAKMLSELLNQSLDNTEKVVFTLHYGEDVPLDRISRMLRLQNQSGAKAYIVSAKRKLARLVQQRLAREKHAGLEGMQS